MKAWIARDKNGEVYLHREKPTRLINGVFASEDWCILERCDFPIVTFENSPVEVEIIEKSTLDVLYKALDQYENFLGMVSVMRKAQKTYSEMFPTGYECYAPTDIESKVDAWIQEEFKEEK